MHMACQGLFSFPGNVDVDATHCSTQRVWFQSLNIL